MKRHVSALLVVGLAAALFAAAQSAPPLRNARVYIGPMANGFEMVLMSALAEKKVPVRLVNSAAGADYVLDSAPTAVDETTRSRLMPLKSSTEAVPMLQLRLTDTTVGAVKWSYTVNVAAKPDASVKDRAKVRSDAAAEVAGHLRDFIDKTSKKEK